MKTEPVTVVRIVINPIDPGKEIDGKEDHSKILLNVFRDVDSNSLVGSIEFLHATKIDDLWTIEDIPEFIESDSDDLSTKSIALLLIGAELLNDIAAKRMAEEIFGKVYAKDYPRPDKADGPEYELYRKIKISQFMMREVINHLKRYSGRF